MKFLELSLILYSKLTFKNHVQYLKTPKSSWHSATYCLGSWSYCPAIVLFSSPFETGLQMHYYGFACQSCTCTSSSPKVVSKLCPETKVSPRKSSLQLHFWTWKCQTFERIFTLVSLSILPHLEKSKIDWLVFCGLCPHTWSVST